MLGDVVGSEVALPKQNDLEHHALADARWVRKAWATLLVRLAFE